MLEGRNLVLSRERKMKNFKKKKRRKRNRTLKSSSLF
jgi:hypothetical protein